MTFNLEQQQRHREGFIEDCRQKAWGAACNANWIGTEPDKLTADFTKFQQEDVKLLEEMHSLETAVDSHTKDNRDKRKAIQERHNILSKQMEFLGRAVQEGQKSINSLHGSIETNLALAKHAETWEWKEVA
jgi:hypothetical protein